MTIDSNTLKGLAGLTTSFIGSMKTASGYEAQASSIIQGGEVASAGARMTAESYRQSARNIAAAELFNAEVQKVNTFQQLQANGRDAQRVFGLQVSQIAKAGLSQSSKSALMVRNEALNIYHKNRENILMNAKNTAEARRFEASSRQVNLENQARAAEYQAQVERVNASNAAAQAQYQADVATWGGISNVIKKAPSLLGQVFSGG